MSIERLQQSISEAKNFFERPGEEVAAEIAENLMNHSNRAEIFQGKGCILGIQVGQQTRFFKIAEVVLYEDEYTKTRWRNSRGPEIAAMEPGEVICYKFHQTVLTFIKTRGAENIMLNTLVEVDRFGEPLGGEESVLKAGGLAQLTSLQHQAHAQLVPFSFRGERAFLLMTGPRIFSDEELRELEEELLQDTR